MGSELEILVRDELVRDATAEKGVETGGWVSIPPVKGRCSALELALGISKKEDETERVEVARGRGIRDGGAGRDVVEVLLLPVREDSRDERGGGEGGAGR